MLRLLRIAVHTVTDHFFSVMFERYHEVRKHTVYLSAIGIAASMPWNEVRFTFTIIMTDYPLTVIPEDEVAFFAHGTKVFTADR